MPDGTYVVTAADAESAVLRDVDTGQVYTLSDPSGLAEREVLLATLEAEPPLEVTHTIDTVEDRWTVDLVRSEMAPTTLAAEVAAGADVGEVVRRERAGEGEVHVLAVESGHADDAAARVLDDEETLARAARLGVGRVEVRTGDGVVSVRYLP